MNWIKLSEAKEDEKPQHGEMVVVANHKIMAVCTVLVHSEECGPKCNSKIGDISFFSHEQIGATMKNVTHFMRIRNPNEVLK